MKKTGTLLSLLIVFALFSFSNIKTENQVLKTSLKITVVDYLGNLVEGASVTLYTSEDDYNNEENAASEMLTTDTKGRVTFKKLEDRVYFVNVQKGDLNNYGGGVQTDKLESGKVNKINIVID